MNEQGVGIIETSTTEFTVGMTYGSIPIAVTNVSFIGRLIVTHQFCGENLFVIVTQLTQMSLMLPEIMAFQLFEISSGLMTQATRILTQFRDVVLEILRGKEHFAGLIEVVPINVVSPYVEVAIFDNLIRHTNDMIELTFTRRATEIVLQGTNSKETHRTNGFWVATDTHSM
jgi:hypothetical protein